MPNTVLDVVTYSKARQHLKEVLDRVTDDHVPVIISRRDGAPAVLVSLDDWNGMQETAWLMGTSANRAALLASIAEAEAGVLVEVDPAALVDSPITK